MFNAFLFLISLVTIPIVSMDKRDKQLYKRPRDLQAVTTINTADKKHSIIDRRIDSLEEQMAIFEKVLLTKKIYSNYNPTSPLYE